MSVTTYDNRVVFADTLIDLAERDPRIVVVCNDSVGSSNMVGFRRRFGERLINVGIAEQDMVGISAGLANAGLVPFVCGAGPFLTGRALEQIKADIAYSRYPVTLCAMSPGFAYGALGPTHHSVEDLSWLRALPGLDIVVPADRQETREAVLQGARQEHPLYIRVGRTPVPDVNPPDTVHERGRAVRVREGDDVTFIVTGTLVAQALLACDILAAAHISAGVVNIGWIAPLDEDAILDAARSSRLVVTAEEANVAGGLGAAVASVMAQAGVSTPLRIHGLREFAPTGGADFLMEYFGLTAAQLADEVVAVVHD